MRPIAMRMTQEEWKNDINDNGFLETTLPLPNIMIKELELKRHTICTYTPIKLIGIEDNNGWIKIESDDDLPKEKEFFRFIPCNNFDREFMGWIDNKLGEVLFIDFTFYEVEKDGNRYVSQSNAWLTSQITHYQPIQKPQPPIY